MVLQRTDEAVGDIEAMDITDAPTTREKPGTGKVFGAVLGMTENKYNKLSFKDNSFYPHIKINWFPSPILNELMKIPIMCILFDIHASDNLRVSKWNSNYCNLTSPKLWISIVHCYDPLLEPVTTEGTARLFGTVDALDDANTYEDLLSQGNN